MQFPQVTGANLLRKKVSLPQGFQGTYNLVFVPFQQWQQTVVNSWVPFVNELEQVMPGFRYYELPTIWRMNILAQSFINEGMRAGIPDRDARERTITLYLDKASFRQTLNISKEDDVYIFLLDRQGSVLWRSQGGYTSEKAEDLVRTLKGLLQPVTNPAEKLSIAR